MQKQIKNLRFHLFFLFVFTIYTLSFSVNILRVTDDNFRFFDRVDETMIIGRLIASQHESPFAYSGLVGGYNFEYYLEDDDSLRKRQYEYNEDGSLNERAHLASIYDDYVSERKIYNGEYEAYKSQPGGQGLIYSLIQEILPFDNGIKLQIIRLISIMLNSLFLAIFMTWVYRNFNLTIALITFLLSAFIPIFILFGYSLWWVLWSYYIPFCGLLTILDYRKRNGLKLFDNKLFIYLGLFTFLKFFLTGFEFITSALIMSVCPIIYYLLLENKNIKNSLVYFFKSSFAALAGIALGTLYLFTQISLLKNDWKAGIEHIIDAFFRRSVYNGEEINISPLEVINTYLGRDVFRLDWNLDITIKYSTLLLIIISFSILLIILYKKRTLLTDRKYIALAITTLISILAPLSWFVLFTQHAFVHSLDIIVWYFPFCLLGFMVIGTVMNLPLKIIRKKDEY